MIGRDDTSTFEPQFLVIAILGFCSGVFPSFLFEGNGAYAGVLIRYIFFFAFASLDPACVGFVTMVSGSVSMMVIDIIGLSKEFSSGLLCCGLEAHRYRVLRISPH